MKKIKIIAVFVAILVVISAVFCACGNNRTDNDNKETTAASGNENEGTTSAGNSNEGTTAGQEDTTLGGYVESEVITMVEIPIEED